MKPYKIGVMAAIRTDLTGNVSLSRIVGSCPLTTYKFKTVEEAKDSLAGADWGPPPYGSDEDVVAWTEFSLTVRG